MTLRATGALRAMLEARSVAVVGASARPGSFGHDLLDQLLRAGFEGAVHPVNPRYTEVLGHRCVPSLAALDGPVDLALLGVPNAALEAQLEGAAAVGARAAVMFASAWEPPEQAAGGPPLVERLRAIARRAGMAVCGPNGMGFVHPAARLRACGFPQPEGLETGPEPGRVTFLTHSGSAFSAILHARRGWRCNLAVSPGMELAGTMADYLDYALDLPSTGAVALFVETARDPAALRAALARAAARDVPVVALKVGRAARSRAMVATHSGALAGEDAAWDALFDAEGVLRVATLDELADTCELLAAGRRAGRGGLAAVHDSGGERALLVDRAEAVGVRFASLTPATLERLAGVLDPGLEPANPLDAWGTANDADEVMVRSLAALADDPGVAAVAFCVDLTTEPVPGEGYPRAAATAAAGTDKPLAVLASLASAADPRDVAFIRAAGVPVLEGADTGLAALRHLLELRDLRARPPATPAPGPPDAVVARWRARLAAAGDAGKAATLGEAEALALLGDYGVPVVRAVQAASLDQAVAAAEAIGWPVALKTAAPGVVHKSDLGGVVLGVAGEGALAAAYAGLAARLGPAVTVAAMAPHGVELALGVVDDDQFGPMVMAAAGGVLVEVLTDRRFGLPPLDRARARAMLDRLRVRPLLDGLRGAPPADVDTVADALAALARLATDLGDLLAAVDVNPVIAGPSGCVAVDAVVVAARSGTRRSGR
jgi:acyl-CoA synthetase (NDP forming)